MHVHIRSLRLFARKHEGEPITGLRHVELKSRMRGAVVPPNCSAPALLAPKVPIDRCVNTASTLSYTGADRCNLTIEANHDELYGVP